MNVIFLDIDGVVLPFFERVPTKEIIQTINEIIVKNDAKIVISSTWRFCTKHNKKDNELMNLWGVLGLPMFIDVTPLDVKNRWKAIESWVLTQKPDKFLIIDDFDVSEEKVDLKLNLGRFLLLTEPTGIKKEQIELANQIMNNSVGWMKNV